MFLLWLSPSMVPAERVLSFLTVLVLLLSCCLPCWDPSLVDGILRWSAPARPTNTAAPWRMQDLQEKLKIIPEDFDPEAYKEMQERSPRSTRMRAGGAKRAARSRSAELAEWLHLLHPAHGELAWRIDWEIEKFFPVIWSPFPCYAEIVPRLFSQGNSLETLMDAGFVDDLVVISTPNLSVFPVFFPVIRKFEFGDWFESDCILSQPFSFPSSY